jgi:hypothetical protein
MQVEENRRVSNPMLEFTAANPLPVSVPSAAI